MWPAKKHSFGYAAVRIILSLVFLIIAGWLWFNQQFVVDQIAVWQYKPSGEVSALAERSGMNDHATFLYYASHPEIDGTQRFNQVCDRKEEATAVLGCYTGSRIFIYDVKDERLDGIKEVTAAHEMLHAAYQRLSGDERQKVNDLLEIEYKKLENREDYKERMAFYARTEPGERANELHSLIGTEVRDISPELEEHYKKYFTDRSKVVDLYAKYQDVFHKLEANAKALYAELQQLGDKISGATAAYNQNVTALNQSIEDFNTRATDGSFTSQAQFANERSVLVNRAEALNREREAINTDIATYESKRQQYNQIASESKQLVDSLNSNLAPAPEV